MQDPHFHLMLTQMVEMYNFTLCLLPVYYPNLPLKRKQVGGRGKYGCSRAA